MRRLPAIVAATQITRLINNPEWDHTEVLPRLKRCGAVFKIQRSDGSSNAGDEWLTSPSMLLHSFPELYNELYSEDQTHGGLPLILTVAQVTRRIDNPAWKEREVRDRLKKCGALFKLRHKDGTDNAQDEWLTTPSKLRECFPELHSELYIPGDSDDLDVI